MAHGGHHSHSHHHYHHYGSSSRSGSDDIPFGLVLGVLGVILFLAVVFSPNINGKKPLEGTYETYESYLIDPEGYFSNPEEIISGLKYLHENTNIQLVVMTSKDSWSDSKAVEKYDSMFSDEGHILLIVPTNWFSSTEYYAIGDLANSVIGDYELDYLLDSIDGSRKGTKWNDCLRSFSDKLLSE